MKRNYVMAPAGRLLILLDSCASLPEPVSHGEIQAIAKADRELKLATLNHSVGEQ